MTSLEMSDNQTLMMSPWIILFIRLTSGIRIFFNDGTTESYTLSNFDFADDILFSDFISGEFPKTIENIDDDFSMYIPIESISIIELPLLKVREALSRLNPIDSK